MEEAGQRQAAAEFARGDLRTFVLGRAYRVRHGCPHEDCGGTLYGPCERLAAAAGLVVRLHRELDYGRGRAFVATAVRPTWVQMAAWLPGTFRMIPSERWHLVFAFVLARDLDEVPLRERVARHDERSCAACADGKVRQ